MENKNFMTVDEVAQELNVSKSYAYKVVRELNVEMQKLGYLTVTGRVNTSFFRKKLCYSEQRGDDVMAVYKDGDKWRVIYRYSNYKGERKQTQKALKQCIKVIIIIVILILFLVSSFIRYKIRLSNERDLQAPLF